MAVGAGETVGTQRFANYGAVWIPVLPMLVLVVAILFRVDPGVVALLLLATLVALGVALLIALSPGVVIDGERLAVPGREDRRRRPGGEVDLAGLTRVRSVSYQGGRVSGRGLALFRNQLLLEDTDGGQAMFWAWGDAEGPAPRGLAPRRHVQPRPDGPDVLLAAGVHEGPGRAGHPPATFPLAGHSPLIPCHTRRPPERVLRGPSSRIGVSGRR